MAKEYTQDELLRKAASYCSIAEHCVSDVDGKLQRWNVPADWRAQIIDRLIADGFINESRYAEAFVIDKFRFNKWGKTKIALALKAKGLSQEDIDNALALIDEGEYDEMLATILKTKLAGLTYEYEYEKQGKLFRFAQSRGFEPQPIERVLRSMDE